MFGVEGARSNGTLNDLRIIFNPRFGESYIVQALGLIIA